MLSESTTDLVRHAHRSPGPASWHNRNNLPQAMHGNWERDTIDSVLGGAVALTSTVLPQAECYVWRLAQTQVS